MGQVSPACLVSDEVEEIFVGNVGFLERLGGRKPGPGSGLGGWEMAWEGSEGCAWNVPSMGTLLLSMGCTRPEFTAKFPFRGALVEKRLFILQTAHQASICLFTCFICVTTEASWRFGGLLNWI